MGTASRSGCACSTAHDRPCGPTAGIVSISASVEALSIVVTAATPKAVVVVSSSAASLLHSATNTRTTLQTSIASKLSQQPAPAECRHSCSTYTMRLTRGQQLTGLHLQQHMHIKPHLTTAATHLSFTGAPPRDLNLICKSCRQTEERRVNAVLTPLKAKQHRSHACNPCSCEHQKTVHTSSMMPDMIAAGALALP